MFHIHSKYPHESSTDSWGVHLQIVYKFTCTLLLYPHLMNMNNSFNLKQVIILVYCIFWWQATLLAEPCHQFDLVILIQSRFCIFTDPIMFIHAICLVHRSKLICLCTFIQRYLALKMYPRLSHGHKHWMNGWTFLLLPGHHRAATWPDLVSLVWNFRYYDGAHSTRPNNISDSNASIFLSPLR